MMSEFKIHHCISELFSILGVNSGLAEKYTEGLKKCVTPSVNTQISASHTVRILAQNSPDPQQFLDKYQELKNLNVQGLDAMVVMMGGIADNSNVRKLIEGASRSLLREDDASSTGVPFIMTRIENDAKEANTKLTKDDLNELRNRLLKESQSNRAPSDAMKHIMKDDKKHSQLGLESPEWLDNRPYLSLDFNKPERLDDVGPLGEVGISTQEHRLLEDLLSVMIGLDGTYITLQADHKPGLPPTFTIDSSVEPSLRALVSRILPLCRYYSIIVQFIEEKSCYHHGLVSQALSAAFRNLLKDYMLLVTQLESHQNRGSLTLHKMWFYVENTLMLMELLACIANNITKSKSHGGAVLSLLHERTLSLTGCKQQQDVLVYLTQAASVPYFRMLSLWIYRGVITDPYKEFMVVDNESLAQKRDNEDTRTSGDLSDDYWEKRYTVSSSNIPSFLMSYKDIILRTGKYLNVIRESNESVVCPVRDEMLYSMEDRSYTEIIERTYNFASKRLLKLLMDEKDLMGRLASVKHYLLLDQGDFVVQMLSLCEAELGKNIDDVVPTRLESLLELALRTSSANCDTYKDDVHCSLLPYTLMSQMLQILSIETEDEQEYRNPPERLQLTGLQGFSLTYSVTWPVSLVLDHKAHFCYQMIFRHLFYCKHVERLLCRVWVCNKEVKGFTLESAQSYTAAFSLRQRMLNFIQNIEYYMMFEVIERNWQTFITKMQKVENIDEVLSCHSDFINGCLKDCMLTSPELLRIVSKLTSICVDFANFILSPDLRPASTLHDSESFEQTIARFDLKFNGMLVTLVDKISDLGKDNYNDALVNVLYRLDFNNYYKKKGDALHMVPSPEESIDFVASPVSG